MKNFVSNEARTSPDDAKAPVTADAKKRTEKPCQSRVAKNFQEMKSNNLAHNKTEISETIYSSTNHINKTKGMDAIEQYRQLLKDNMEYDYLMDKLSIGERDCVEEILELMLETICIPCENVRIGSKDIPYQLIKGRLLKSGVKEISTEPALQDNLIEYQNTYYKIGTSRMEVKDTKVVDENYYILTLAALAKELKMRGRNRAKVVMGVGLPLTRFGAEKRDFVEYLSRQKEVHFKFEGEHFNIRIEKVMIYPQCYGVVMDKIGSIYNNPVIVDIGIWIIDIMPIINQITDEANCKTIPKGLIT